MADKIAIVGAACRFPGAPDLDTYEQLLFSGTDAVTEIPDARWSKAFFLDEDVRQPGKSYTFAAGVLDSVDQFDAGFFGVSPREATHIDPQQRLALELAFEALEDAGATLNRLAGADVGVFVGASSFDYLTQRAGDVAVMDAHSMQGLALSSISNRISYAFDLKGPSFTVDTACSSSMVALHLACEALRRGEAEAALAGGVNLLIAPQGFIGFSRAGMLSRRGRCHAFDARADGYVRAEGGAILLLKPLESALSDGDRIRGVIRATGVNSDGRTTGLSLPSREGQARLLRDVYGRAGVAPDDLSYLEAHGTGTPVGDPIEAGAIADALSGPRATPLPIGSAKTNIGHLEAASGMAGLLKALAALERREAPPTLHLQSPNPNIPFEAHKLHLTREATPLRAGSQGFIAGVNSFGFGGTNAHAVVEAAPRSDEVRLTAAAERLPPLLVSARDEEALRGLAGAWRELLAAPQSRSEVARLLRGAARRRSHHAHRLVAWGETPEAISADLTAWLNGETPQRLTTGHAAEGRVAFVFSGNGSQWAGMGRAALETNATFRSAIAELDGLLSRHLSWSVEERLARGLSSDDLADTTVAQPVLFAVQVASVRALTAAGVHADAFAGHSVGEVAAAWASGALTLAQACEVVAQRSRLQGKTRGAGGMAALGLSAEAARAALTELAPEVHVAAVNSPSSVTLSGPDEALRRVETLARSRRWLFSRLDIDYAFHSPFMDSIRDELLQVLSPVTAERPRDLLVSTVTGEPVDAPLEADYWWRNVRAPVRFAGAVEALSRAGVRLFVEIGPQPILQSYIRETLKQAHAPGRGVGALSKADPTGADPFQAIAARCHAAGADISRAEVFDGPIEIDALPRYAWSRQSHWVERTAEGVELNALTSEHELLGFQRRAGERTWFNHLSVGRQPWLADHQVDGAVVLPAAAMVEMALAAARLRAPDATAIEILDLEIGRPMLLDGGAREVRFTLTDGAGAFSIDSKPRLSEEAATLHAKGRSQAAASARPLLSLERPPGPSATLDADAFYARTRALRLQYGPAFQTVTGAEVTGQGFAEVRFARPEPGGLSEPLLDPTLLDGALQGLVALHEPGAADTTAVPWRFGRVRLLQPGATPATARVQVRAKGPRAVGADILLLDGQGGTVAELTDCWFVAVDMRRGAAERERRYWTAWTPTLQQPDRAAAVSVGAVLDPLRAAEPAASVLLAEAFVLASFQEALLELAGGMEEAFAPALLAFSGRAASSSIAMIERMIAALHAEGVIQPSGEAWRFDPEGLLPPSTAIWRSLEAESSGAIADLTLAAVRGAALAEALRSGAPAWPEVSGELKAQMLFASPGFKRAEESLFTAIGAFAKRWPQGAPLRAAIIGGGDPVALRRLVETLDAVDAPLHLTAFARSEDEAGQLLPLLSGCPGGAVMSWDERREGSYDLVVGYYPFSGERPFEAGEVAKVLAQGGVLIAAEPCRGRFWPFAMLDEAPLRSDGVERAQAALAVAGCDVRSVDVGGELWSACVLAAQNASNAVRAAVAAPQPALRIYSEADDDLATALAFACADRGRTASTHPLDDLRTDKAAPGDEVIVFVSGRERADAMAESAALIAASALSLQTSQGRLWLVASRPMTAASLEALRRVLANEVPSLECRVVELDPALGGQVAIERLVAELAIGGEERSVRHTLKGRFSPKLEVGAPRREPKPSGPRRLEVSRPGLLSSLAWVPAEPPPPGPGEVAIEVRAAGLNFRDVMWAAGLLPDEALLHGFSGPGFGLECSGLITAVGPGVDDLRPGQPVVAVAPAALATHAVTKRHAVLAMPDGLGFEAAATVPVAYLTVAYGLGRLARLEKGERVLIHGGAGGVGLAAIQYAQRLGAEVFATAGSPAKRELLRRLGVDHVFDSRSAAFADDVLRVTGGEGVDVILNSLSDELMQRSLRLLRPFGRFVEIGKRDLFGDTAVGLRPLRHNASYFAVDVDQLAALKPAVAQALFTEVQGLLAQGALRPLPYRLFGFDAVIDAFRLMQGSGHIGKIVLVPEPAEAAAEPAVPFTPASDGVYVVTGGLGGFGLETARWLARKGARSLALISRRGSEDPAASDITAEFASAGVQVRVLAADVSVREQLDAALAEARQTAPIRGVVHAAAVIEDGLLPSLDAERFARVLRPKLDGAIHLDELTRRDRLDLFLVYSSISNAVGNPGQAPYVVANAAMEALIERRRSEGLPGLAVRWGPIADVGYLEREQRVKGMLDAVLGGGDLTARTALDALPGLLHQGEAVMGYAEVDWSVVRRQLPIGATSLFADMPSASALDAGPEALKEQLTGLSEDEAQALILEVLVEETAAILRLPRSRIDVQQPLADIGCDSLMAVELRLAIEARLGGELPLLSVSDGASLDALAARIVRSVRGGDGAQAALVEQVRRYEGDAQAAAMTQAAE